MAAGPTATSIDGYIASFPAGTRTILQELRALIRASAPEAVETISYAIPTFDLNGKHVVSFAGYERHIGLYPAPIDAEGFKDDLLPYRSGRATARFPIGDPLPADLIRRIVEFQLMRVMRGSSGRTPRTAEGA